MSAGPAGEEGQRPQVLRSSEQREREERISRETEESISTIRHQHACAARSCRQAAKRYLRRHKTLRFLDK